MRKLLTICIPTYKRETSLRRCIELAVAEIEASSLSGYVNIFVANDASPDGTASLLEAYRSLSFFSAISRERNLGMSPNIRLMLEEASHKSEFQLIVTDDDYLQPGALRELVDFLLQQRKAVNRVPAIWTPRSSYTDDGEFHCVVCDPFEQDRLIRPSAVNAGRYMANAFVLSGLVLRGDHINYDFWRQYEENAFFPVIFFGDLLATEGAYFWKNNVVHHTVLNKCHWERWGKNDVVIEMRLFLDFIKAYYILATKIGDIRKVGLYFSCFPSIYRSVNSLLAADALRVDRGVVLDAISELAAQRATQISPALKGLVVVALVISACVSATRATILHTLSLLTADKSNKESRMRRSKAHARLLRTTPLVFELIANR